MISAVLLLVILFLAFANGANDNFKGVATLVGSRTTSYRRALVWAQATTFAGAGTAMLLYEDLVTGFSGGGIVPDGIAGLPSFLLAAALAAALTVILATALGLPISTTHGLVGGIAGAGLVKAGDDLSFTALGSRFLLPLIAGPLLAVAVTALIYPLLHRARLALGLGGASCLCLGETAGELQPLPGLPETGAMGSIGPGRAFSGVAARVGEEPACKASYPGQVLGIPAQKVLDGLHFASAGAVCFARGLNDAPKIAAMSLGIAWLTVPGALLLIAVAMVAGGLLAARRVARTMSERITAMNDGQGCTANLVTAGLVLLASRSGLPLSTTHVSCGALFGLGAVTGQGHRSTIAGILLAWVTTLPLAAALGALIALLPG